jgi:hypothetical protein
MQIHAIRYYSRSRQLNLNSVIRSFFHTRISVTGFVSSLRVPFLQFLRLWNEPVCEDWYGKDLCWSEHVHEYCSILSFARSLPLIGF